MKYAEPATGNGPLTGVYRCPQTFPTQEVPNECEPGWEKIGGVWQKGAALIAQETAEGAEDTERAAIKSAYAAFKAGTATGAQVQRAIAVLIKRVLGG